MTHTHIRLKTVVQGQGRQVEVSLLVVEGGPEPLIFTRYEGQGVSVNV